MKQRATVAVIGAGWAGCTAAIELAEAGHDVTLFEAARIPGGRARSVEIDSHLLDNGQHILLGAYSETLNMMRRVGVDETQALLRLPLQMRYPDTQDGMDFICPHLPAPLHLLFGLLRTKGLTRDDKLSLARFSSAARWIDWKLNEDCSVLTLLDRFDQTDRLIKLMWRPLCIAALNTIPEQASAQIFLNVLRDSLGARRAASNMLIPRVDLHALFPKQAISKLEQLGGHAHCGMAIRRIEKLEDGWRLWRADGESLNVQGIVIATSNDRAIDLLRETDNPPLPSLEHEPITTCYLRYARGTRLPHPIMALCDDAENARWGQFVFDRGQLDTKHDGMLAVVISAAAQAVAVDRNELAQQVAAQLAQDFHRPELAKPEWTQVISEKRATFSCTPGLVRPEEATTFDNLVLAGDYLASEYPATIEAAVRSGKKSATLLNEYFAKRAAAD